MDPEARATKVWKMSKQDPKNLIQHGRPAPNDFETYFNAWKELPSVYQESQGTGKPIPESTASFAAQFSIGSKIHTQGRRVGITEKGHACLVPPRTAIGDLICAFEYIRVPYVIREARPESILAASTIGVVYPEFRFYYLVGQCYAQGLMFGEESVLRYENWSRREPIQLI